MFLLTLVYQLVQIHLTIRHVTDITLYHWLSIPDELQTGLTVYIGKS